MLRIGTDIGGTFTDIVVMDDATGEARHVKVLTSAKRPAEAVVRTLEDIGVDLTQTKIFSHGTTIAINAIIQQNGARTGVVMTRGFRDTLELRRGARTHILDPLMDKPTIFSPRRWRTEVNERILADGTVEVALDREEFASAVADLVADGVEAIAVCFLHSYAHPEHELIAQEVLQDRFPDLSYTLSSDVVPEIKEFERTSTAVLNAYCQPVVEEYLASLESQLQGGGLTSDVLLMQSNGGLVTAKEAARNQITILESGPASGAIAAARLGGRIGLDNLITFDMGGTTAKSAVVEGGEPLMTVEYELFEEQGKPGSGWPIRVPMVDIVEIGAGGGSIAWLDESGRLQVGPRSAGSEPGPVCYGRGGTEPTITDAHAILGNLHSLLGGEFPLDIDAARAAMARHVADPLGLSIEEAAVGVLRISNAKVADLIREVTVARGRDPRAFGLICYGGAGPLEAAPVLRELDMPLAIIPPTPGTFSAFGLLDADVVSYTARTFLEPIGEVEPERILTTCMEMEKQLIETMDRQGQPREAVSIIHQAELRYRGQFHQIAVDILDPSSTEGLTDQLARSFNVEHLRLYTYVSEGEGLELVNLRARATALVPRPEAQHPARGARVNAPSGARAIRFTEEPEAIECHVYDRTLLGAGEVIEGPAVIEEYTSATTVPPGFTAEIDDAANIVLRRNS
jgi:N-methylhydantoinase A